MTERLVSTRRRRPLAALAIALAFLTGLAVADYRQPASVVDEGGPEACDDAHCNRPSIGQTIAGESGGYGYVNRIGFLNVKRWADAVPATPTPTAVFSPTPTPSVPYRTPTPVPITPSPTPAGIIGDVDGDGRINTSDALLCFQIALALYSPTPGEAYRADADGDGRVNTLDALCIFQEALGLPNECFEFDYWTHAYD